MATRFTYGKFKLSEISEERVHQLALALRQDTGKIVDQAIAEFYAKNRESVVEHKRRLEEGLVFEGNQKIDESKE